MVPIAGTIACLPVAGPDNPYQNLMMDGLNESGRLKAYNGADDRFFGIARTCIRHRPNYLHFDWIISYYFRRWPWFTYMSIPLFCVQIVLARLLGVKLVWSLHNVLPHDVANANAHRFCQRFLARRCAWIRVFARSTVPEAAAELNVPEGRFRVVPEGDYVACYPNTVTVEAARRHLGLPSDARVLLYLGFIKPYKGVLELVRIFNETPKSIDAYLLIAGKGKDAAYLAKVKEEANGNVRIIDQFIPAAELQYYYNASDAVVLPFNRIENSGSVIMAMGFSRPVIAPAQGVLTERLSQQKQLLYNDTAEFRRIIASFFNRSRQSIEWSQLGERNYQALKFRWEDFSVLFQ